MLVALHVCPKSCTVQLAQAPFPPSLSALCTPFLCLPHRAPHSLHFSAPHTHSPPFLRRSALYRRRRDRLQQYCGWSRRVHVPWVPRGTVPSGWPGLPVSGTLKAWERPTEALHWEALGREQGPVGGPAGLCGSGPKLPQSPRPQPQTSRGAKSLGWIRLWNPDSVSNVGNDHCHKLSKSDTDSP